MAARVTISNLSVSLISFKLNVHICVLWHIITINFQRGSREIFLMKLARLFLLNINLIVCWIALIFLGDNERMGSWISYL